MHIVNGTVNKYIWRDFRNSLYNALGLTEAIGNHYTCLSIVLVFKYPVLNVFIYLCRCLSFIDWKAKRRFGNESIARYWFELSADAIINNFIIAAYNPYFAVRFYSYLRRSYHMTSRVKRNFYSINKNVFIPINSLVGIVA